MRITIRAAVGCMLVTAVAATVCAGCAPEPDGGQTDGTLHEDGYALFRLDNARAQQDDVTVRVLGAEPGVRYALLMATDEPATRGWFALPEDAVGACAGRTDDGAAPATTATDHAAEDACDVPGGRVVDVVTTAPGATEIALRHTVKGSGRGASEDWRVFLAVLRLEETGRAAAVRVEVVARRAPSGAEAPAVVQVQ
jgi:hypothetical protein